MRINPVLYGVLVVVIFFGVILGFQAAGVWSISGKVDNSGKAIQPDANNVESIKGWMTLEQICETYQVSLPELLAQFGLPADTPATTAVKDLESDTFDTTALRTWLQNKAQGGEPVQPATTSPTAAPEPESMPQPAVEPTAEPPVSPTAEPTEHTPPARTITGKTTFQELLDWGLAQSTIEGILGEGMPAGATVIKDYVTGKGLEFSSVKTSLQAELDKLP